MSSKKTAHSASQVPQRDDLFPVVFAQGVGAVNFGPQVCKLHFVDNPSPDDATVTVTGIVMPTASFLAFILRSIQMLQEDGVVEKFEAMQEQDISALKTLRETIEKKR